MEVWINNKTYVQQCYCENLTSHKTCIGVNTECDEKQTEKVRTTEFLGLQTHSNQKTHTEYIIPELSSECCA